MEGCCGKQQLLSGEKVDVQGGDDCDHVVVGHARMVGERAGGVRVADVRFVDKPVEVLLLPAVEANEGAEIFRGDEDLRSGILRPVDDVTGFVVLARARVMRGERYPGTALCEERTIRGIVGDHEGEVGIKNRVLGRTCAGDCGGEIQRVHAQRVGGKVIGWQLCYDALNDGLQPGNEVGGACVVTGAVVLVNIESTCEERNVGVVFLCELTQRVHGFLDGWKEESAPASGKIVGELVEGRIPVRVQVIHAPHVSVPARSDERVS